MPTTNSHLLASCLRAALASLLLILLTACDSNQPVVGGDPSTATSQMPGSTAELPLTPEQVAACQRVLSGPATAEAEQVLVIKDATASVAAMPLPAKLAEDIVSVSKAGGVITVIAVDGPGVQPRIITKRAALSTPGPRDRPSVTQLAAIMPRCVAQVLLEPVRPVKPGTDLYQAMSLGRDLMTGTTRLWTLTDLFPNAGQLNLTEGELLRMEPKKAAKILARTAPLDLKGVVWHLSGVANTTAPIIPASRSWMLEFARALCTTWRAAGCDAIQLDPVNPDRPAAEALPKDRTLPFPGVDETTGAGGCSFTLPSAIAFDSESDQLREGASELLTKPIALMQAHPSANATIVGHTASISRKPGTGKALSRRRAVAVQGLLVEAGIDPKRISVKGVGDTDPLGEDINPRTGKQIEARAAKERRVTVAIKDVRCSG
jgi:outer membrane protein OmpA-like peptidoglycan-associated protein